jgi:two-component system sensor histidine kinase MprB
MSFRRRIALVSAAAVAVAVVLASVLVYVLTSNQLHGQVDTQLRNRSDDLQLVGHRPVRPRGHGLLDLLQGKVPSTPGAVRGESPPLGNALGNVSPRPNQVRGYQQLINSSGTVLFRSGDPSVTLPVDSRARALATGRGSSFFRDATVKGVELRILAERLAPERVVQFAQPLTEVNELLSHLRLILVLISLGGVALAALLGRLVAGAAVLPLKRLTQATEHVAATQDLSGRIESVAEDEIGRLAKSFNSMLDALERSMNALDASVHAQRQLVADASHELRTPVTSLRTNIEILQQAEDMDLPERRRLLSDVVEQIEELTLLMNDLIDLARGEEPHTNAEDIRLDIVLSEAVDRAHRHAPGTPLLVEVEPTIVTAVPDRVSRAVGNLIDNAVKYSPPGEPVEINLRGKELTVRDHGPGISAEDLPYVFDRFYRGAEARGRPGSGLGLAIVRQVVNQQGGSVSAEAAPGGGTLMRVRLPDAETMLSEPSGPWAGALSGSHPQSAV